MAERRVPNLNRKYWLKILIPLMIPGLNIILLLIWALSKRNQDTIRKSFAQTYLIIFGAIIGFGIGMNLFLTILWSFFR